MPIVIFAGRKGGCGKTTGATNFAAWLAKQGKQVALLDTDPERQAQTFVLMRATQADAPQFPFEFVAGDVRRTIISMAQEFEWVIVDTPGLDSLETKKAVALATVAVFPFKTSIYDLKTIPLMDMLVQEVQAVRPEMVGLAYCSETDTGRGGEADRETALKALQKSAEVLKLMEGFTADRKAYRTSASAGKGVVEWQDAKAAEEFDKLAREICSYAER